MAIKNDYHPNSGSLNRGSLANKATVPSVAAPSVAELSAQLHAALQRIASLESQLHVLQGAVHVVPGGDVEIHSKGTLRLIGDTKVVVDGKHGSAVMKNSSGNAVTLSGTGITVTAASKIKLQCPTVEFSAAISKSTGMIKCDQLVATTVVAHAYTPGAGNVW